MPETSEKTALAMLSGLVWSCLDVQKYVVSRKLTASQ